jgi:hypothetical protein
MAIGSDALVGIAKVFLYLAALGGGFHNDETFF